MINFLTTATHGYTVDPSSRGGTKDVIDSLRLFTYEGLSLRPRLMSGCYIFSDIERLKGRTHRLAARLHDALIGDPRSLAVNHPGRSLDRYRLLRRLEDAGVNNFGVRLVSEVNDLPFPMFLRHRVEHTGALTALLHDPRDLEDAIESLNRKGMREEDILAVQFVDVSDAEGVYRKYGAFNVGGRIVARHLLFMNEWSAKYGQLTDESKAAEELAYVESNPHEKELASIFELAEIGYGRIDYALAGDRVVVWEVNTNPQLNRSGARKPASGSPLRARARSVSREHLRAAFAEIEASAPDSDHRLQVRFGPWDRVGAASEGITRVAGRAISQKRLHGKWR